LVTWSSWMMSAWMEMRGAESITSYLSLKQQTTQ